MLKLELVKRTNPVILEAMSNHYSKPKGFVGRNICYVVSFDDITYGAIAGGSATMYLPGRDEFFGIDYSNTLEGIINNIFFHVEPRVNGYPFRNFTTKVVKEFRRMIIDEWWKRYRNEVIGFETLVELPRSGTLYVRDGWTVVGRTKGYTCKREAGVGTDSWSGKRVWNTKELRPKLVFCRKVGEEAK